MFGLKTKPEKVRAAFIKSQEASDQPWAMFEVDGFEDDGKIKVIFNWNEAFIKKIQELGFHAETAEDSVQLFFYTSQMKPTELADMGGDESVQSAEHPNMSPNVNRVVR